MEEKKKQKMTKATLLQIMLLYNFSRFTGALNGLKRSKRQGGLQHPCYYSLKSQLVSAYFGYRKMSHTITENYLAWFIGACTTSTPEAALNKIFWLHWGFHPKTLGFELSLKKKSRRQSTRSSNLPQKNNLVLQVWIHLSKTSRFIWSSSNAVIKYVKICVHREHYSVF